MKKKQLDNAYSNIFIDEKEVFALSLPITIIYRQLFSQNENVLQTKYSLIHSEIDVLATLLFNGKVMTPTDLYEATIFSSGGMTKILKKLENKELISRVSSPKDKRSKLVQIELKGEELVKECFIDIIENNNKIFSVLSKKERDSLKGILKKLVYSLVKN